MSPPPEIASKHFPTFKEALPMVEGKVFVITGTTSGTGFVAAQTVAEKGGQVVCLNRKSQRVTDATAKLQQAVPNGNFVNIECDLQDFDSVKKAAKQIKSQYKKLYCLSCNAGIMMTPDAATKDGCDTQMQTNHLSHFLLAKELYDLLEAEATSNGDARIVFHSSGARDITPKGLEKQYFEKNGGNLGGDSASMLMGGGCVRRYAQTKLANSVMIRLALPWFENFLMKYVLPLFMQSAEDGTMGLLKGMMDPEAESGILYGPAKSGFSGLAVPNPPKPYETDPDAMKLLWETSEAATGTTFTI